MNNTDAPTLSDGKTSVISRNEGALGAEVKGVNLRSALAGDGLAMVKAAFLEHHLVCFRSQDISNEDMLALASEFGELERHLNYRADGSVIPPIHDVTNLDASGKPSKSPLNNENYYWHSDKSYRSRPASLTMLFAVELPPDGGGDTQFANMTAAFRALPEHQKLRLRNLKAVHSWRFMREKLSNRSLSQEEASEFPDVVHPLVRVHPETGDESLYLGMYASRIVGLEEKEGRELLDMLVEHSTQPQFVHAHQWKRGDLVMWDNRCLMHRAVANYELGSHRRVLRRVVVQGGTT